MTNTASSLQDFLSQLLGDLPASIEEGSKELSVQAKTLGARGEDFLIDKLGLDDTAENRAMVRQQAKYAGMAGGLALLLKSRSMRKVATLGGLAALGTIAYRGHKRGAMPRDFKDAIGLLKGQAGEDRADILLKAMVAAAKADGTFSDGERALIAAYPAADEAALKDVMSTPADPTAIASLANSDQSAAEIYAVSARIADGLNPLERNYLDSLAMALGLDPEAAALIETEVRLG
jgi:uncharacterized membrane protein YebE (DUF533 family)